MHHDSAGINVKRLCILLCAVLCCVWSGVCFVKYRWRREEEETRQMYVMVEQIVGKEIVSYLLFSVCCFFFLNVLVQSENMQSENSPMLFER